MNNRILIIEHRNEILSRMTDILVKQHYIVDSTKERSKGIAMALEEKYDLILADADIMQNGDLTVATELKKHESVKHIPLILISTPYKDIEFIEKTKKLDIDGILFRPFSDLEILSRINTALKIKRYYDIIKESRKRIKHLEIECDALTELGDLNIDAYLEMKEKYDKESIFDETTSLINLKEFFLRLDRVIAESIRYEESVIYAIYDIDNFSDFEHSFDVETTKEIIQTVSSEIVKRARKEDIVARMGEDTFIVVYKRMREEYLEKIISDIHKSLNNIEIYKNDIVIKFSVSVGAACVRYKNTCRIEKIENEIKEVELAIRNAKRRGGGSMFIHPGVVRN